MKKIIISALRLYQKTISPDSGYLQEISSPKKYSCVFYPTCSEYTIEAIEKYGVTRGITKGARRILRCHPWQKNRMDPLV